MKKILLFLLVCISISSYAQLDREHWFAPMYDGQSNGSPEQYLHLSTNETTPFNVQVFSNNVLVYQKTISKGNPGVISIDRSYIITDNTSELHRVGNKGLYVKAAKPCFANLRFRVTNHAEIITSKGTAGIGTKFYTVVAPNVQNSNNLGFAASFLATEDNTSVTVNNFKKNLNFNSYGTATSFTFTLNKGQSYIIDGRSTTAANFNGFIGATVTADKPISMSNGNFNGQYATTDTSEGSDILMDQSVPVDKLGDEFVIVKGYGAIGNNMEGAIIVATEKNTAIYLNDSTTPITTLANEGDYYLVQETNYVLRGSNHYNLHIKTDKNVYVYQLLGGVESGSSVLATGGMNYIPPLNCYLPKKIDELSYISRIAQSDTDYTFLTKLNIITAKGAVVKVNGVIPSSQYGPYDISSLTANQNWVTYSIPSVTGNITVESTKAVTAGIASGNNAFGYGGYFAGFSSIPLILKTDGECLPGVRLEITEGFDSYEWLENVNGTYVPAPGVNNTFFYEPTQAGIYAVKVKQGSCPEIQTKDYKFYNCTTYTNYDYKSCGSETIIPKFALSTQAVNPSTVQITTPPTKGTATIATDGTITYALNPGQSGTDTFKFSFCGIGTIPDCETVQATIQTIQKYDVTLNECSVNGTATYKLSTAAVSPDTDITKTYFKTPNGALTNIPADQILNFDTYTSADASVYVRIKNSINCIAVAKIDLRSKLAPEVKENLYTKLHCDEDIDGKIDGIYKVDLATITPIVLVQASNFVVKYYDDPTKAGIGGNDNITGILSFTANRSVWIRVDAPNGCPTAIKEIKLKIGTKTAINDIVTFIKCDNDLNNSETIKLSDYTGLFTSDPSLSVNFYKTLANAQNNTPITTDAQTITGPTSFFYRFKGGALCEVIGELKISLKGSTPTALLDSYKVCEGGSIPLSAEGSPTYKAWLWEKAGVTISTTENATLSAGVYKVSFTDASDCVFTKNITVVDSPKPNWNILAYDATNCDDNFDGIIKINLNNVTPIILPNAALFTVEYFRNPDFTGQITDLANFTYSVNTTIYVRAKSTVCPTESRQIDFKFGNSLALIKAVDATTICDNDLNNTENINLGNYRTLFTADATATVKYFATLANAQNNTAAIPAAQTITGDKTFYYRFKKAGLCDAIGTLNVIFKASTPTALLDSYTVCEGSSKTLTAENTYTAYLWKKGTVTVSNTDTAILAAGVYTIAFTNASGCVFTKTITIVDSPKPNWNITAYNATNCDDNFDGIIKINLNNVTPIILPNAALFTVEYFRNPDFTGQITDLTNFTYSVNTTIYVRAKSTVCPTESRQIDFKLGNSLTLIKAVDATTICDNDLNNTENINLGNYRNLFTSDAAATVKYFATLANAQNNTAAIPAAQTITGDKTFYYRFKKTGFCDVIGTLNITFKASTPTALLDSYTVCAGSSKALTAESTYTAYLWKKGATTVSTTQTAVLAAGVYTVSFTNASGCIFTKNITILESPKPIWKVTTYNAVNCDENFDGIITIDLSKVTPLILPNFTFFTVEYFTDSTLQNPVANPNAFTYSANTTIYVRATSPYCPAETKSIDFKLGNDIPLITDHFTATVCDDDFDGIKSVNLSNYRSEFTVDAGVTATYFSTKSDAQNNINAISNNVSVTNSGIYYLRFHKTPLCDVIGELTINIQKAKKSDILVDQNICPNSPTLLDAGPGFDGYLWSTGEKSQQITAPVGEYWVDLLSGTCTYRQNVSVKAVSLPQIVSVEIKGSTVTVTVTGGNPPYQYAIDNSNYQSSNVFTNVRGGDHTVYVKSADNCDPVSAEINVIELYNAITPNGDGINDVLNYSSLLKKDEPFIQIFDRYGKIVFKGDKNNNFSWDGKANGKLVATGSYWYIMKWKEPGFSALMEYSGWVLVKNRE